MRKGIRRTAEVITFLVGTMFATTLTASCAKPVVTEYEKRPFHPTNLAHNSLIFNRICAIDDGGTVGCWWNEKNPDDIVLTKKSFPPLKTMEGSPHILCGLESGQGITEGALWCTGVGVGIVPRMVIPGILFTGVDVSDTHACAYTKSGEAYCGGLNGHGQLGDGSTEDRYFGETNSYIPVKVRGLLEPVVDIALGSSFTCVLAPSGRVLCWGRNRDGELGTETFPEPEYNQDSTVPAQLPITDVVTKIEAGGTFACAWTGEKSTRKAFCWGRLDQFQSNLPVDFPSLASATSLSIQHNFACAVVDGGKVNCFGTYESNRSGTAHNWSVLLRAKAMSVTTFYDGACAILDDSQIACWGDGTSDPRYNSLLIQVKK